MVRVKITYPDGKSTRVHPVEYEFLKRIVVDNQYWNYLDRPPSLRGLVRSGVLTKEDVDNYKSSLKDIKKTIYHHGCWGDRAFLVTTYLKDKFGLNNLIHLAEEHLFDLPLENDPLTDKFIRFKEQNQHLINQLNTYLDENPELTDIKRKSNKREFKLLRKINNTKRGLSNNIGKVDRLYLNKKKEFLDKDAAKVIERRERQGFVYPAYEPTTS